MNKKLISGIATGMIMLTSMGVAFGIGTQYEIKATMDSGVTIKYKGEIQELKDVNGVTKDPIMYNGTTYVPIRSVAEMLDLNVDWDNENRMVIIKDKINVSLENDSLSEIMEGVYNGFGNQERPMMLSNTEITDDTASYYLGLESLNGAEAIASEPMIGSIAHSVCLLRVPEGADVEAIKTEIIENVNPYKWVCVGVEKENIIIDNIGNVIILIMSEVMPTEQLHQNFLSME